MLAHKKEFDAVSIDMPQTTEAGTSNLFYFVFILCAHLQFYALLTNIIYILSLKKLDFLTRGGISHKFCAFSPSFIFGC